uniref:Uncharacterized protein n=1 Tax=Ovis aries TaxID=9940 RepID=A0AC11BUE5_SHEEP
MNSLLPNSGLKKVGKTTRPFRINSWTRAKTSFPRSSTAATPNPSLPLITKKLNIHSAMTAITDSEMRKPRLRKFMRLAPITQDEILIRLVLSLLLSWDEPLHHVVTELQGIKDASPDLLSKAAEIEEKTKVLLEGAEQIQTKIHPEDQEKETSYPVWSEISLTAGDEDVRQTAFYKMFHCLHRDAIKIDIYL